jgi:hypothetical protein
MKYFLNSRGNIVYKVGKNGFNEYNDTGESFVTLSFLPWGSQYFNIFKDFQEISENQFKTLIALWCKREC